MVPFSHMKKEGTWQEILMSFMLSFGESTSIPKQSLGAGWVNTKSQHLKEGIGRDKSGLNVHMEVS